MNTDIINKKVYRMKEHKIKLSWWCLRQLGNWPNDISFENLKEA